MTLEAPLIVPAAKPDERFLAPVRRAGWSRVGFGVMVALVLALHVGLIAAFLYRDAKTPPMAPQPEETPIEVVREQPKPEPPPPPDEKKPPPPKAVVDDKPAFTAPRAPDKTAVETERSKDKTAAPRTDAPPRDGQVAPSETQAPLQDKPTAPDPKEAGTLEDDKREAEALDKAKIEPKPAEVAKAAPPRQASTLTDTTGNSFAAPTMSAFPDGGEDERYNSVALGQLIRKNHYPGSAAEKRGETGVVVIAFTIDYSGRVAYQEILQSSGKPDLDEFARKAVQTAGPFPYPPGSGSLSLRWAVSFGLKEPPADVANAVKHDVK